MPGETACLSHRQVSSPEAFDEQFRGYACDCFELLSDICQPPTFLVAWLPETAPGTFGPNELDEFKVWCDEVQ